MQRHCSSEYDAVRDEQNECTHRSRTYTRTSGFCCAVLLPRRSMNSNGVALSSVSAVRRLS